MRPQKGHIMNGIITEFTTLKELLEMIGCVEKADKTPTAKYLRENAGAPVARTAEGDCVVYENGYAVYSNISGTAVVWLSDCKSYTYRFAEMNSQEKLDMPQTSTLETAFMEGQPWFLPVMLRGDHQVENNGMNQKSDRRGQTQNISLEFLEEEDEEEQAERWIPGCHFENPESAYIKKETLEEQMGKLTDRQREVFWLYYGCGYTQEEIAGLIGLERRSVRDRLEASAKKFKKVF
jgi:RNA polymerase sigma factor (sigma-70 family)